MTAGCKWRTRRSSCDNLELSILLRLQLVLKEAEGDQTRASRTDREPPGAMDQGPAHAVELFDQVQNHPTPSSLTPKSSFRSRMSCARATSISVKGASTDAFAGNQPLLEPGIQRLALQAHQGEEFPAR